MQFAGVNGGAAGVRHRAGHDGGARTVLQDAAGPGRAGIEHVTAVGLIEIDDAVVAHAAQTGNGAAGHAVDHRIAYIECAAGLDGEAGAAGEIQAAGTEIENARAGCAGGRTGLHCGALLATEHQIATLHIDDTVTDSQNAIATIAAVIRSGIRIADTITRTTVATDKDISPQIKRAALNAEQTCPARSCGMLDGVVPQGTIAAVATDVKCVCYREAGLRHCNDTGSADTADTISGRAASGDDISVTAAIADQHVAAH